MLSKHKQPSLEAGLLIVLLVISVFAIGLSTGKRVTGMATAGSTAYTPQNPSADWVYHPNIRGLVYEFVEDPTNKGKGTQTTYMYNEEAGTYIALRSNYNVMVSEWEAKKGILGEGSTPAPQSEAPLQPTAAPAAPPSTDPTTHPTTAPPTGTPPPLATNIKLTYLQWTKQTDGSFKWVETLSTPPPNTEYKIIKTTTSSSGTATNEEYWHNIDNSFSKLVNSQWVKDDKWASEITTTPPTATLAASATPQMDYTSAKSILQGADLWIDPKTQADIETKLPLIQAELGRQGLKTDALIATKVYETEAILFAQAYQKAETLKNQDTSGFNVEQLKKYFTDLKSAQAELKARQEAFVNTAKQARQSIVVYEDATYDSNKAQTDLEGDDTAKQKAIAFYAQVANGEKKDIAATPLTPEGALAKLKSITYGDAQKIATRIEAENTAKLRIDQTEKATLIQKGELVYKDGQYYYQGQKGDDFYYDPATKKIVLIKTPKAEQTPGERAEANQKILNLIDYAERGNYKIDENGNLINKNDGFVYRLKSTTTGISLEKAGAPSSIFINSVELKRLENYEISKGQSGLIEGSGVYKGSDGILYDQKGNKISANTEISFTANKGSQENPVYLKTYFKVDSGNRQGKETWITITDKSNSNPIELSQEVYKRLGISENDKLQYSGTNLEIRNQDNKLKASVSQNAGDKTTTITTGYNKDGINPTNEQILTFGKGVKQPATIERNKKYEYGYDKNKDGKIEDDEKEIRLTVIDEATIKLNEDRLQDLKVIREHSWDEGKGEEIETKVIVYDINGKPVGYGEDINNDGIISDNEMYGKNSEGKESDNQQYKNRLETLQSQWESRKWFADFEFKLTQFKGLSGWSQLIWSDEELAKWRGGVDKFFSTFYLGTDYWVSEICSKYIPKQQRGTFMMETKDGLFDVVAHVEGEKTIIHGAEGTQYIYKLTFSVRNPKYSQYDKLKFNVYLYGQKTVQLYHGSIEVEDGKDFTRGTGKRENGQITYDKEHGKPIVQYSGDNYNKICIKFDNGILNAKGRIEDEVCNAIVEYKGSPTEYQERVTTTAGTPTAPGEPYQEVDF